MFLDMDLLRVLNVSRVSLGPGLVDKGNLELVTATTCSYCWLEMQANSAGEHWIYM